MRRNPGVFNTTEAGQVIEPSVSVPSAIGAKFKATATAEPELEPHGLRVTSWALWVCPPMALQPDDENERKHLRTISSAEVFFYEVARCGKIRVVGFTP